MIFIPLFICDWHIRNPKPSIKSPKIAIHFNNQLIAKKLISSLLMKKNRKWIKRWCNFETFCTLFSYAEIEVFLWFGVFWFVSVMVIKFKNHDFMKTCTVNDFVHVTQTSVCEFSIFFTPSQYFCAPSCVHGKVKRRSLNIVAFL